MTTLDVRVAASADDANELSSGNVQVAVSTFNVDQVNEWGAARFSITIPDGATINVAYLTLQFDNAAEDEPDLRFYAEDVASAAIYVAGTATFTISGRVRTTASVDWGSTDLGVGAHNTASLVSIIQELMGSYSYAAGAYMGLMWTSANGTATRDATVTFYDGNAATAPLLHIEYTAGGGGQTINADAIASTATVYQPSVTVGAVTVSPNLIASTSTVYQPAITTGSVIVAPNLIASAEIVYQPAVATVATITPTAIGSAATVYEPVISVGAVAVTPELVASTAVVYQPSITIGLTVQLDFVTSVATVYQPAITTGAVTVSLNTIASVEAVYQPLVQLASGQTVNLNTIASTSVVYQVIVALFTISAERTYSVPFEDRVFAVELEERTFDVAAEIRVYTVN